MKRTALTASAVWRTSAPLIVALQERFGEPLDAYVNGSQVWLREDGPHGTTLEWRLHPVAGYQRPVNMATLEVFASVVFSLSSTGEGSPSPNSLWDGLECFAAFDDDLEPALLVASAMAALGIEPDFAGLVDHRRVGDEWERSRGATSILTTLIGQLQTTPAAPGSSVIGN